MIYPIFVFTLLAQPFFILKGLPFPEYNPLGTQTGAGLPVSRDKGL